jgi:hypothetical protein
MVNALEIENLGTVSFPVGAGIPTISDASMFNEFRK